MCVRFTYILGPIKFVIKILEEKQNIKELSIKQLYTEWTFESDRIIFVVFVQTLL